MRATEDKCVDIIFKQRFQVLLQNGFGNIFFNPVFFYKVNEQWRRQFKYFNLRVKIIDSLRISSTFNGAFCSDHTNAFIPGESDSP